MSDLSKLVLVLPNGDSSTEFTSTEFNLKDSYARTELEDVVYHTGTGSVQPDPSNEYYNKSQVDALLSTVNSRIASLQTSVNTHTTNISTINTELTTIDSIEQELDDVVHHADAVSTASLINDTYYNKTEIDRKIETINTSISSLANQVSSLIQTVNALSDTVGIHSTSITNIQNSLIHVSN